MFGELVVAYLFLGGCGGGGCAVTAALGLLAGGDDARASAHAGFRDGRGRVYGRFFGGALAASLGALALGMVCLLFDVGRPDRLILLAASFPTTYLAVGAWALAVCAAVALAVLLMWRGVLPVRWGALRAMQAILLAAGLVTVAYTGLLLGTMPSVPLWYGPWLPAVFVLSGLSCGIALVLLSAALTGSFSLFGDVLCGLVRADSAIIACEALAVAAWLAAGWLHVRGASAAVVPTPTDEAALASLQALCCGAWAPGLWLGLCLVGLAVPLAIECRVAGRRSARAPGRVPAALRELSGQARVCAAALCVLAGGALLRYLVVAAAVLPAAAYSL